MPLSNTIVNQIDNLLPESTHTMATAKVKFRRNSKHTSWKNTKKQRQWSPRRNNQRRPEHMDFLSGEINKTEFEKTPSEHFQEMSNAGLDDDIAMTVTARQMRKIAEHEEIIRLFKQWYSLDTTQAVIDLLPTQIWALWTQIQYNYASW